jgi:hypothetical protein
MPRRHSQLALIHRAQMQRRAGAVHVHRCPRYGNDPNATPLTLCAMRAHAVLVGRSSIGSNASALWRSVGDVTTHSICKTGSSNRLSIKQITTLDKAGALQAKSTTLTPSAGLMALWFTRRTLHTISQTQCFSTEVHRRVIQASRTQQGELLTFFKLATLRYSGSLVYCGTGTVVVLIWPTQ